MEKELINNVDTGQCQARNSAAQGDARAIATSSGAIATTSQVIVQMFIFTQDSVGAVDIEDLGKLINVVVDKEGNLNINGTKINTSAAGDGVKMVVLCQKDIQQAEAPNEEEA